MSGATEKGALDDTVAFSGASASQTAPELDATQAAPRATDDTAPAGDSSALETSIAGPKPPLVAGYDIIKMLGRGGMGVVWEARDHKLGRTVALKVHSGDPTEKEALWVEARLAAKIAHPGIVPVHDVGFTAQGDPFYTMDLLEGTSLRTLLRDGKLPFLKALSIMNNVTEAVAVAHERGVVHCDLKPGNIFIDTDGRARVLDFGLAFTAAGTAAHALGPARGSPPYMSPEQIAGGPLSAATDVYSLGVVLFEMITATLPFQGQSTVELFSAITLEPAPKPSSRAPNIGESIDALCLACLQKNAESRPQNARALQREIRRILEGDESPEPEAARSVHNSAQSVRTLQPRDQTGDRRTFRFEVLVDATPAELWPLVSNTDRFNSAVGLPAVTFEPLADPRGAARKSGRFRVLGMDVAWDEHPFEWSREREHAVFRKYTSGPLAWLQNRVTLSPRGDQTNLVHEVTVAPRSMLGTLSAFWEIQWKMGRRAHAVYRRMGEAVRKGSPDFDAYDSPHDPTVQQIAHVSRAVERLAAASDPAFPPALIHKLRDFLLRSPDRPLERIRPFALADKWSVPRSLLFDLLLFAASQSLVDIAWDLVCPGCYVAHEVAPSLRRLAQQGQCDACGEVYTRDLADSVELIFRPHREVRDLVTGVYCTGSPAMRPHVLLQQVLDPREQRRVTVNLPMGQLYFRVEKKSAIGEVLVSRAAISSETTVSFGDTSVDVIPAVVRPGNALINLLNHTDQVQVVRLMVAPDKADSVTAALAITHPTFRTLFSEELLAEGEHLRVGSLAFVALSIVDRARLLSQFGDAAMFARFRDLAGLIEKQATIEQGTVFRNGFEGIQIAFPTPAAAVRSALALVEQVKRQLPFTVKVAVHCGRCIAVSRGAHVEYFGETIEQTLALLVDAGPNTIAISSAVDSDSAALGATLSAGFERRVAQSMSPEYGGRRITRLTPTV